MIEAVENHMPEVIVIDEIGTELEALAARTIAERGVQLVGTAHGNTLDNLLVNPTLSDLVGGIQAVTLGDEEARRRGTQKTVLERKAPPTFDVLVEQEDRHLVAIHHDVAGEVDGLLRGDAPEREIRERQPDGTLRSWVEHAPRQARADGVGISRVNCPSPARSGPLKRPRAAGAAGGPARWLGRRFGRPGGSGHAQGAGLNPARPVIGPPTAMTPRAGWTRNWRSAPPCATMKRRIAGRAAGARARGPVGTGWTLPPRACGGSMPWASTATTWSKPSASWACRPSSCATTARPTPCSY